MGNYFKTRTSIKYEEAPSAYENKVIDDQNSKTMASKQIQDKFGSKKRKLNERLKMANEKNPKKQANK